ncbi:MAG: OmpA family protein [Spirochaetae bacterium HGW-Spirochaetae-3]|jgi:outer membrane protein OmpA-like peptidoglycan-associated protein|nr:MAG: OmpA family protein [Spirochaetae bacterium HGW-Spirochaetae-3]
MTRQARRSAGGTGARHSAFAIAALAALSAAAAAAPAGADEFRFQYETGDKYRVVSTVDEDVYVNRRYSHSARIVNRIAFEVADTRADGSGLLRGDFSTSVQYAGGFSYVADRIYRSEYWQAPDGRYDIAPEYYMPTVRHVPTFPARDLKPGDTWNAPGEERHDFREDFGIPDPYLIPIDVRYTYEGPGTLEGKPVRLVRAAYTVFVQPPRPRSWTIAWPTQIAGYSDQLLYWDQERGGLAAYEERFKFVFELSDGRTVEYRGEAGADVVEAKLMDRAGLEEEMRDAVSGLDDVTVTSDERGVTISLENIQFEADSARLSPPELAKIEKIASLLAGIKGRDIQVSGHTALAGTAVARQQLSVERARAVADELIRLGVREAEAITVLGYGAEKPVADNSTEAGKARNRRVEITILEN